LLDIAKGLFYTEAALKHTLQTKDALMGRVIAVTNLKGGIGKTTTVVNVGAGLALKGARVLLVDVDAQGNLAMALGIQPKRTLYEALVDGADITKCITPARPNLDLLPADESLLTAQPTIARRPDWPRVLEQALRPIKNQYDFLLIDCGGSLTVLNINALTAANDVLVPTTVEPFSVKGLDMLVKQVIRVKNSASSICVIVPTMFDPRLKQSHALLEKLTETYGDLVASPIRVNVRLSEASAEGRTIYEYDSRSRGAYDYAMLVERLSARWGFVNTKGTEDRESGETGSAKGMEGLRSDILVATQPVLPVHVTTSAYEPPLTATPIQVSPDQPIVAGAGTMLSTCPNCGHELRRAMVAGYRVAYCNNCKYRHQELATGTRR
jgi:chromosome partitioning protein